MYIRNSKGKLVKFDINKYTSDKQLYKALWFELFNIKIKEQGQMDIIINYIKNK